MEKSFPIHMIGEILWLPPYRPDRKRFPPEINFRVLAKFTSDFLTPDMTALVNYSPNSKSEQNISFNVRLYFAFLEGKSDEIKRLSKNTEIIFMDAFRIIAICRKISLPDMENRLMQDEWLN